MTTDFRNVFGTVIDGWMGGGGSTILNGAFENLGFFQTGPGRSAAHRWPPADHHRAVEPDRVRLDEPATAVRHPRRHRRPARSARRRRVVVVRRPRPVRRARRRGRRRHQPHRGRRDVADVRHRVAGWADRSRPPRTSTRFRAWPCPNLAIIRLGAAGDVNFYNNAGNVHLLGDVVGYFRDGTSVGMSPLAPARLLDTRDGTGGHLGALGAGQMFDLQVAGRGGVVGRIPRRSRSTSPSPGRPPAASSRCGRRASRSRWRRASTWCPARPCRTWCWPGSARTGWSASTTTPDRPTSSSTCSAASTATRRAATSP